VVASEFIPTLSGRCHPDFLVLQRRASARPFFPRLTPFADAFTMEGDAVVAELADALA